MRGFRGHGKESRMQSHIIALTLGALPRFIKVCPRCGNAFYENSGCFRVNANGKRLDIWLICRCEHCKSIWNLCVAERIDRKALNPEHYQKYLENDSSLVLKHVFDPTFLANNRAVLNLDGLDLSFSGDCPQKNEACEVTITCAYPLPLPVGCILAQILSVSLSRVRRMQTSGTLIFSGDLRKTKVGHGFCFALREGWKIGD
jgi:hypothetical protein